MCNGDGEKKHQKLRWRDLCVSCNVSRQEQLQGHGSFPSMCLDGGVHVQHLKLWHMFCTCKRSDFTVSGFLAVAVHVCV